MNRKMYQLVMAVICLFNVAVLKSMKSERYELLSIMFEQYDQLEVLNSNIYQGAAREAQLKMLEDHFHKKHAEMIQKISVLYDSAKCNLEWGIVKAMPLAILGYKLRHRLGFDRFGDVALGIGASAVVPTVANGAFRFANQVYDCSIWLAGAYVAPYLPSFVSYYASFLKDNSGLDELIKEIVDAEKNFNEQSISYVRIKPLLSLRLQKIIEKYFVEYSLFEMSQKREKMHMPILNEFQKGQSSLMQPKDETLEAKKNMQLILDVVLHLPDKTKPLTYIPAEINKAFFGYTSDVIAALQRYCIRQTAASKATAVRKVVAYFWGPPGTGKTRAAGCIADALKLPLETLSLSKITPEDLIGTEEKPGLLLDVMTRAGRNGKESLNNMVLLLDDADRVLNEENRASSFILNLLEPETKSFYSPFLQSNVDISHLCIILAGNSEIRDDALRSRLQIVKFDGYNADYKKAVVWKTMLPELIKIHENSELPLIFDDVKKEQAAIDQIIEKDDDLGFRSVKQRMMEYLEGMVLRKYFPISTKPESLNLSQS